MEFYNADIKKIAPNEIGIVKGKGKGKGPKKKEEEDIDDLDERHSSSEEEEDEEGLDEYEEEEEEEEGEEEEEIEEGESEDEDEHGHKDKPAKEIAPNVEPALNHEGQDESLSSDDIMDSFIDDGPQVVKYGKQEKDDVNTNTTTTTNTNISTTLESEDDEPPILIRRKKKKVEKDHQDDDMLCQDEVTPTPTLTPNPAPGKPTHSSDKFLKKMLSKNKSSLSGGRVKDKVIASKKGRVIDYDDNNNNNYIDINKNNNYDYEEDPLTPPPPLSPLSPEQRRPSSKGKVKGKGKSKENGKKKSKSKPNPKPQPEDENSECFLVNVRFPLNINPGYIKMMSCPLFTWNCDFRKEKDGYLMLRVNSALSYKDRDTFDYSTLCRVANINYNNKKYCGDFKKHLKKLGITMKTDITSSSNSLIPSFYFPLIRMTTVPVLEMRLYFDACRYILLSYEDYFPNSKLLSRLEEETRVEEKDNVLQYWNMLKKGKPEDRFKNSNPVLCKAWDIYHKLTDGAMAKEKVVVPFDKGVHDILVQDTDKFHVEKNFYSDKLEVTLKSVNNKVLAFASVLKDIKLEVSIFRVEDDYHNELFEEYETVQFKEECTYFLVSDSDRGHFISQEHDVVSDFIRFDIEKIPKDCKVLIIDRVHLFPFTKLMEAILKVKTTLKKLRIYGSFFSPYYQKEGYNLIEVFAWKQKEGKQNNNVTYTSMCPSISAGEKKLSFYNDLNNLKKDVKADSKFQYTAFYSKAGVRDEYNLRQVFLNIHETTVFNWFEGGDNKKKTYGKVIIIMKAMDAKKLAIVFNHIKNCEVKVYGSEEEFFELLSSVPKAEPKYTGFVNYL